MPKNRADIPDDEEWLSTEVEAGQAAGPAAAALLQSVAQTLSEAPEDRRYDIVLTVEERNR